jgi:hypothetical protein
VCVLWVRGYFWWKYEGIDYLPPTRPDTNLFHYGVLINPFGIAFIRTQSAPPMESFHSGSFSTKHAFTPRPAKWRAYSFGATPATLATMSDHYRGRGAHGVIGIYWLSTVMTPNSGSATQQMFLPHWLLALATGALPALWGTRRWCRRAKACAGLCSVCGYDLRASPTRCPECGTVTATKAGT